MSMTFMILSLILAGFGVLMLVISIVDYCISTEDGFGYYHRMKECAVGIFVEKFALALVLEIPIMFWNFFYSFELNSVISWLIIGTMILIVVALVVIGYILKEDEGLFAFENNLDFIIATTTLLMPIISGFAMLLMISYIY